MSSVVSTQAGIDATFNQLPTRAVENLVGFLGDGSPLKSLLDELAGSAGAAVALALKDGIIRGRAPEEIARDIRGGLNGSLTRARGIARNETLRAYREAAHQNYLENSGVVTGWVWTSALGPRSCAACVALSGTFHPLEERMASHVNCRCSQIPQIEGVDPKVTNGVEWFAKQPAAVQEAILDSPGAYEAYKSGRLSLEDFVGLKRDKRWGDSYQALSTDRALAGEGNFPRGAVQPKKHRNVET
jgi:SPP1 gp7 family putative phage head morphogenesis protein